MGLEIRGRAGLIGLLALTLSACGSPSGPTGSRTLQVVAGENFWGSIASQLGGTHVTVTSVVTNPNADPHDYETSSVDARVFATADYVILNGAGYDDWGNKLLAGNPNDARRVFVVADLLHKKAGDNPHFWYNPDWVEQVADHITADYEALDEADRGYFDQQRAALHQAMQPYHQRITSIRNAFHGTPVGATESIFVYLAQALDLNLISPPAFMQAVAEGNDPPAGSVAEFQNQLTSRQTKVLVVNVQTASNLVDGLKTLAADKGIPVVGVSETLQPADATFQAWQLAQLQTLENALGAQASTH